MKKATVLSLAMSMALALPIGASAQEGLFQRGVDDESYYGFGGKKSRGLFEHRDNVGTTGIIENQVFGQDVPLGGGLLVLIAAGAGYAALKRKEEEK